MNKIISTRVDWSSNDINDSLYCLECGKPYYTAAFPNITGGGMCECADEIKSMPPKQYGWICPACGCGNASWASRCGHCTPKRLE